MRLTPILAFVLLFAVACGGDDKPPAASVETPVFVSATNQIPTPTLSLGTSVPGATATPQRTPGTTPGVGTGPEVGLTASAQQASVAATAAARSMPTSAQATALAAAVTALKGADCTRPGGGLPSPNTPCVGFVQTSVSGQFNRGPRLVYFTPPQDITKGLALFKADLAGEDRDYYVLFGRDAAGAWKPFGAFTNVLNVPVQLPWEIIACPRAGLPEQIALRDQPVGAIKSQIANGTRMKAEEFVLVTAGSAEVGGNTGGGYFRITSPASGWVDSRDIEAAVQTRCLLAPTPSPR